MDRMVGGVGLRRGRRDVDEVRVGDAVDFWRVESVEYPSLIRLRAEMKVPGDAWLQFEVSPSDKGFSCLGQTAFFAPRGLAGFLYWYLLYPIHSLIFAGMIKTLAQNIEDMSPVDSQLDNNLSPPVNMSMPAAEKNLRDDSR